MRRHRHNRRMCGGHRQRGADGCYVLASTGEAGGQSVTTWARGCCSGTSTTPGVGCSNIHESQDVAGASARYDQSWCDTNDCNTMDPRSSAGALASTLALIVAAVAVINF